MRGAYVLTVLPCMLHPDSVMLPTAMQGGFSSFVRVNELCLHTQLLLIERPLSWWQGLEARLRELDPGDEIRCVLWIHGANETALTQLLI